MVHRNLLHWLVVGIGGLLLSSCSSFRHGYTLSSFEGQVLPAREARGADRLDMETDFDATIKGVVETQGTPDYIMVESGNTVKLMYVTEDRVISFQRGWGTSSKATVESGIPEQISALFTAADRERLASIRGKTSAPAAPLVPVAPVARAVKEAAEGAPERPRAIPSMTPTSTRVRTPTVPLATRTPAPTKTPITPKPTATRKPPKATATPNCISTTDPRRGLKIVNSSWTLDRDFLPMAGWTVRIKNVSCSTLFKDIKFQTSYSAKSGTTVDESVLGHTEFIVIRPGQTVTVKWDEMTHSQAHRASVHIEGAELAY